MSSRDLYVVYIILIRVLGLYVLSVHALNQWISVLAMLIANLDRLANLDWITVQWTVQSLVQAVSHTVVGVYFLIRAEQVARFAEMFSRSSARDESEESRRPGDEPTA